MAITELIPVAFLMGLVGSLHCIGMCGPLAMALPLGNRATGSRLYGGLLYNAGRIFTYTWLGLALGLAGDFLITPAIQSSLSIGFGAAILLYLFLPASIKQSVNQASVRQGVLLGLRKQLSRLLSTPTNSSLFSIGLLNGLLPCGMIYLALTTSFLSGSVLKGGLFMAFFGVGTLPAMLAVVFFGSYLNQRVRINLRKTISLFLGCMAALLVLRGLNLGIPYLSPALPQTNSAVETLCH